MFGYCGYNQFKIFLIFNVYRGFIENAFDWIIFHGIASKESYGPYLNQNGYCHYNESSVVIRARLSNFLKVKQYNINALKRVLVRHGPVAVSIDG